MINNSKILTVSYGTFSCTLEGFDDSFTTMKAIAEYFRDLASDDRYFGAEPPTPDAEMLARIAEREIERRVEARESGGKIVLRAEEAAPAALVAGTQADAPQPSVAEDAEPAAAAEPTELTAKAPEPAVQPAAEEPLEVAADEAPVVAAPKSEGFTAPMPAPVAAEPVATPTAEADQPVEQVEEIAEVDVPAIEAKEAVETAQDVAEEHESESTADDFVSEVSDADETPDVAEAISHPDPDSVAAKLSRIRSVVAQNEQPYGDTAYSEDEHANDFLETNLADLDAALAADDAAELDADDTEDDSIDLDAALADADAEAEPEAEAEADTVISTETSDNQDDDSSLLANISALSAGAAASTADAAQAEEETEEQLDAQADTPALELTDSDLVAAKETDPVEDTLAQLLADAMPEDATEADSDDTADTADADRPLNARVVKVKTSDLDAALAAGELQEAAEGADTVNLFNDEDGEEIESTLSDEEEAELQRELAEVEAEFTPEDIAEDDLAEADRAEDVIVDAAADDIEDAYEVEEAEENDPIQDALEDAEEASARGVDRLQSVEQASDVSRIFDEVDQQRDEPGSSERRNAIQHLRAAVAATRADQSAGVDISKDKDDSAYRSDLADVVRPRRPRTGSTTRSQRPGTERPAPLKLVAEQRIDTPQEPVRPRRITTTDLADMEAVELSDADSNFADFAEEMGAGSLPELLEAAAAYMADVEGRPQFSRPMLMGKLKEVEGDEFSREDGLRSFGQLLRQGKLQKLKGGRFAVTDETDYRAQARNVG